MAEWELHGPTVLTAEEEPGWDVLDEEGWSIAFVYSERLAPHGLDDYNGMGTASLIKAAPKLLEAVRRVSEGANDGVGFYNALIAEAEGRTP